MPCVAFDQSFVKLLSEVSLSYDQLSSLVHCGLRVSLKVTRRWFVCIFEGHVEDLVLVLGRQHSLLDSHIKAVTESPGFCGKSQASSSSKWCHCGAESCFLHGGDWWHGDSHVPCIDKGSVCAVLQNCCLSAAALILEEPFPSFWRINNGYRISCSRVLAGLVFLGVQIRNQHW